MLFSTESSSLNRIPSLTSLPPFYSLRLRNQEPRPPPRLHRNRRNRPSRPRLRDSTCYLLPTSNRTSSSRILPRRSSRCCRSPSSSSRRSSCHRRRPGSSLSSQTTSLHRVRSFQRSSSIAGEGHRTVVVESETGFEREVVHEEPAFVVEEDESHFAGGCGCSYGWRREERRSRMGCWWEGKGTQSDGGSSGEKGEKSSASCSRSGEREHQRWELTLVYWGVAAVCCL